MFGIEYLFFIRSAGGGQVLARLWRVGRSMFDVGCSSFNMFDVNLSKQLSAYEDEGEGEEIVLN